MAYKLVGPLPPPLVLIQAALGTEDAERLEMAYRFAYAAHDGQCRDEGTPFIDHPVRVARLLWNELGVRDTDLLVAALNHDAIEDAVDVDAALVASIFGERVASLVIDVTKENVPPEQKPARDRAYLDRLPTLSREARLLKLADRIDNLRSVVDSGDPAKAARYLEVSRAEFIPLATMTDPVALDLVIRACDRIEAALEDSSV